MYVGHFFWGGGGSGGQGVRKLLRDKIFAELITHSQDEDNFFFFSPFPKAAKLPCKSCERVSNAGASVCDNGGHAVQGQLLPSPAAPNEPYKGTRGNDRLSRT